MKIVNREDFLNIPVNTLYCEYEPCVLSELNIKRKTIDASLPGDFYESSLIDIEDGGTANWERVLFDMEHEGKEVLVNSDGQGRAGDFDKDQMYIVFDNQDIDQIIQTLTECKRGQ